MENELRNNVQRMIDAGVPEQEIGAYVKKYTSQPQRVQVVEPQAEPIDDETGASYIDRFIIGSASSPEEKLNRARGIYGDSVQSDADGRISFMGEGGKRTYVNPSGFDFGDVVGSARELVSAGVSLPFTLTGPGIVAGTAAGTAAGQGMDALAAGLGRARAILRGNQAPQQMSVGDVAKDAGVDAVGGLLGGYTGKGLGAMASHVATPVRNSVTAAWQNLGLPTAPSLAMAGKGKMAKIFEAGLASSMFGADAIDDAAQVGRQAIAGRIDQIGRNMANGNVLHTPQELGSFVMDAARKSRESWSRHADSLETSLYNAIGDNPARLDRTRALIQDMKAGLTREVGDEKTSQIAGLIRSGFKSGTDLNINSVRALKQKVGRLLDDDKAITNLGLDKAELEMLYGSLSEDLLSAVRDPRKLIEVNDFNNWYKGEKESRNTLERLLFPQGQSTLPEYTGKILMSPNVSPSTLQVLEKVMDPDTFGAVRGSIVSKLARPRSSSGFPTDEVSPETLLTNIGPDDVTHMDGAMAPEVRQQLFGGLMDDVRQAAGAMRDAGRAGNTSGTGRVNAALQAMVGGTGAAYNLYQGDPGGAAAWAGGALALPFLLSKAHTNPAIIRALSNPQGPVSRFITDSALPSAGLVGGLLAPSIKE